MERDDMSTRNVVEERNKNLLHISTQGDISLSAHVLHDDVPPAEAGMQSPMYKFLEAIETFTSACTDAYKGPLLWAKEEKLSLTCPRELLHHLRQQPCWRSGASFEWAKQLNGGFMNIKTAHSSGTDSSLVQVAASPEATTLWSVSRGKFGCKRNIECNDANKHL
ncbi:hypothetical protein EJB05_30687, partial [Eragrostis curvula]